ncbi:uncharacterized protein LOC119609604 [Lucilia sericata]|uniref:uncharacterized protein LOC119609604 n=1 Tax=Lucilia sericata TaxID=13632 RepID=UPI0018A85844|nr:uncharacterized protein LOC119609604 [Lucilia sericata]
MSIPRLELQSALLGARFAKNVTSSLKLKFNRQVFWTDSKTVLAWIRSDHRKYFQFVAFRVSEILELSEVDEWMWVPSMDNVADEATKWQKTPHFSRDSRWFTGPEFLQRHNISWHEETKEDGTLEELRPQYIGIHRKVSSFTIPINPERFSKWSRFVGATSTLLQIARIIKNKVKGEKVVYLKTQADIAAAEIVIWKCTQAEVFGDELTLLSRNLPITPSSNLYKLSAYLDNSGVIRLGSRVQISGRKDPIILPKEHYVTTLLVAFHHVTYLHSNHETVINEIRQYFWIPRLRSVLKKVRKSCQMCIIQNAKPKPPKMSILPSPRVASFCRPFTYVGIDYFGPLFVIIRRSSEKRYGVLFTCLTTRAVHLEIAYSLSTISCIIAIRSFIARRGTPREWWSDNGTNFRGAERELSEAFQLLDQNEIVKTFTNSSMSWHFIPPSSPHMGGAWERLVRSVKSSLLSVLPRYRLTDEILRGAFAEVENIINSRPLTYIPIEHEEAESLTPNHFLHGSSNGMKPLALPEANGTMLRRGWRATQQMADSFWIRWVREYLPMITRRSKWFQNVKPIKIGDVVFIVDPEIVGQKVK